MNDEVYFWYAYEHQSLLKFDAIILVCVNRHAQSTQNNFHIFAIFQKRMGDEVDVLPAE